MKKLIALLVVFGLAMCGTAMAADKTWVLNSIPTAASIFASPVTENGVSVYVLSGGKLSPLSGTPSGVSLIAINPATGTSATLLNAATGSSAYGTPAVISGETVFAQVSNPTATGTSVFAVNGVANVAGASYYAVSLKNVGIAPPGGDFFASGTTQSLYSPALTIPATGASIYAVSTASASGATIMAINRANGTFSSIRTGVSIAWAAPLVSGNSIYILGDTGAGTSIFAYNTTTPFATGASATILGSGAGVTNPARPFATPAISGNSIFVVDATGGLTAYNKNTLVQGANDFIQFATAASSSVTGSPVTDGKFLAVTANDNLLGQAGVTVFDLSKPIAGGTGSSWWFAWTGATITATPAISNGVLYVALNRTNQGGQIERFNLSGHAGRITAPDFTTLTTDSRGRILGFFDYSSPIIKSDKLIIVSNGGTGGAAAAVATPVLYSFDLNAKGTAAWPQFKFDPARTGNNTASHAAAPAPGDNGGCFISTIK